MPSMIPPIAPIWQEIGQEIKDLFGGAPGGKPIGQTPGIGQGTLDEQIQQASKQCLSGDQAACSRWYQLAAYKAQGVQSGNTAIGSTPLSTLLTSGGTTTGTTNRVAFPFDPKFFTISGYSYDAPDPDYPDGKHHGTDYGLPAGTPVQAMMQGTAHVYQDQWLGNVVEIKMANGQTARYAHLGAINIQDGQQVSAGQQLALSDTTGNAKGAHLHFEILDATGKDINPEPFLTSVFAGQAGTQALPDGYYTIDGHFVANGSPDDVIYKMAQAIWRKEYGTDPSYSIVNAMRLSGAKTIDDLQAMVNAMPSSIPGVNIGIYNGVNANLQRIGTASFGRPMSQALLRQFLAENITTPEQMQGYFDSHPASQIPKDTFQAAYDIANQTTQGVWGAPPTLDQVYAIAGPVDKPPIDRQVAKGKPVPQ